MNEGYLKIHRQLFDNEIWLLEPFTKGQAWVDLFGNANYKDGSFEIRGNIIEIKRGQIGWSEITMAKRWTWSRNKVRRFLKWLETKQQIKQDKLSKLTTVITIINYEKYQPMEQQTIQQKDNRKTTDDTQTIKDNKRKENNNNTYVSDTETFISTFNSLFNNNYKATPGRVKKITTRRKNYTLAQILLATKNLSLSEFHRGKNDRGWIADPDFLIDSDEKVDKWLNPPKTNLNKNVSEQMMEAYGL